MPGAALADSTAGVGETGERSPMLRLVLTAYVVVLGAELVGDKLLCAIGVLATRHATSAVASGVALALTLKLTVAVLFGHLLATLPVWLVRGLGLVTFLTLAVAVWRGGRATAPAGAPSTSWIHGAGASFATVFCAEWCDVGQLATATLAAQTQAPLAIGLGAWLAYATKATLALGVGMHLRQRVPGTALRGIAAALCFVMAILTGFGLEP